MALVMAFAHAAPAAELPPVADFFRHAKMQGAVLAPNGRAVAVVAALGDNRRQRLMVIDLDALDRPPVLAGFADVDVQRVHWVNDERLVFTIANQQSAMGDQPGEGLFAIDRLGKEVPRRLIQSQGVVEMRIAERSLSARHRFFSTLRDGSNDVIVQRVQVDGRDEFTSTQLLRLDTATGISRSITDGAPAGAASWALDAAGRPRALLTLEGGKQRLHWKPSADAAWVAVRQYDSFGGEPPPELLHVGSDNRLYAVAAVDRDRDTASLVRYDMSGDMSGNMGSGALKAQPLMSLAGFDFRGQPLFGAAGTLLGVHFLTEGPATHWYDAGLKAIQQKVDALLPATSNRIDCGRCASDPLPAVVLVVSTSDRQPAVVSIYDVKRGTLETLGSERPWIQPAQMATLDLHRITARDGLSLPVYITRPPGLKGPAPAVVLVHGGPWVRGVTWGWHADAQFLASRGYVVIEPEFRGSTGYGDKLFRAGFKQWGLAMQDDVADAAQWAVKQGYADAKRMCIAGASYGGYATLMGLIRHPELFRCGVEWVGVSDIDLMYSIAWSDAGASWQTYGMPVLVGDRVKDAAQLAATSPLKRAAELRQPLLMAYGGEDRRVPLTHGTAMRDALRATNPRVEFVVYPGEGHGFMLEANRVDFWSRVERFLAQHLAPVR